MLVSLIVAIADNGVIGAENALPWRLPEDMRWFRRQTTGKPVVMGRKTHESIGRPLPERTNIVLTRDPDYRVAGCTVVHDIDQALAAAGDAGEVMVMGGAEVYRQFLPRARRLYLTRVHMQPEGDAAFPAIEPEQWREVERDDRRPDADHAVAYSFLVLERQ